MNKRIVEEIKYMIKIIKEEIEEKEIDLAKQHIKDLKKYMEELKID